MAKKVLVAIPPKMIEEIDLVAKAEFRTRSDMIREALRHYVDNFKRQNGGQLGFTRGINNRDQRLPQQF